jgi:hypothetical protein
MKFMIISKATADSEAGRMPDPKLMESMIAFNEKLANDGVLIACEGLHPSSNGTRLRFDDGRTTITDGPFAETKELIGGFWLVQGKSRQEVVERFSQMPFGSGGVVEIRQLFGPEDIAAVLTPEQFERTERVTLPDAM